MNILSYTQPPNLTREEVESLFKESRNCVFCSFNKDGTIHAAPVWYLYEDGKIIIGTPELSRKARNAKRNSNVTVMIEKSGWPAKGVIIYGKAKLGSNDAIKWGSSWAGKYMPKEKVEPYLRAISKISNWVQIIVKPERMGSFDYAKDEVYGKVAH